MFSQYAIISETKIVFSSYRDGNHEIYVMNPDGSDQKNLTNNPAADEYPSLISNSTCFDFSGSAVIGKNHSIWRNQTVC